jgi:hypothetical protein
MCNLYGTYLAKYAVRQRNAPLGWYTYVRHCRLSLGYIVHERTTAPANCQRGQVYAYAYMHACDLWSGRGAAPARFRACMGHFYAHACHVGPRGPTGRLPAGPGAHVVQCLSRLSRTHWTPFLPCGSRVARDLVCPSRARGRRKTKHGQNITSITSIVTPDDQILKGLNQIISVFTSVCEDVTTIL